MIRKGGLVGCLGEDCLGMMYARRVGRRHLLRGAARLVVGGALAAHLASSRFRKSV